jgi:inner membrane protein
VASLLSHPLVPVTLGFVIGRERLPARYWVLGAVASMLPDGDVLAFAFGIPYEAPFGHRGATHSIVFAAVVALLLTLRERRHFARHGLLFIYLLLSAVSHPLLDMLTNGGLGIALFWPFSYERYFFPCTPIEVSPIGAGFFSHEGLMVFASELRWIWLPCAVVTVVTGLSLFLRKSHSPA